jgi:hypothetical protein
MGLRVCFGKAILRRFGYSEELRSARLLGHPQRPYTESRCEPGVVARWKTVQKDEDNIMNDKQRSEVEYIIKGRPDVKFEISERANTVVLRGKGEKEWPEITVGRQGGVQVWVRSYDGRKKSPREWALEADDLLEKQTMRDSKKAGIKQGKEPVLLENYNFFACAYLNDWWQSDRSFVKGLRTSNSREVRLYWLREAATYYQVGRNFEMKFEKLDHGKGPRLGRVLDAHDEVKEPITSNNVVRV